MKNKRLVNSKTLSKKSLILKTRLSLGSASTVNMQIVPSSF